MNTSDEEVTEHGQDHGLSWSRTVAREMVHRRSVAEVLLTDVRRDRGGGFEAAASWPRSHPTFPHDGTDLHSPLILVETLRQLGIYIPLRYFDVPSASRLLITDLQFALMPDKEPRIGCGCSEITCRIAVSDIRTGSDGRTSGLRLHVTYLAGGVPFAHAGGGARFLTSTRYADVRADRLTGSRPPPTAEGRPAPMRLAVTDWRDVVITRKADALEVEPADPYHPFFFDHATDHVPGMVLLEAARQAAAEASDGVLLRPTSGHLFAVRFTEFAPPARVECVPHHLTCVFRIRQGAECSTYGVLGYGRHAR
ncbi:A-factor biosynthesis hotdog domain-containing protein [Streptomyces sp. DvalAA-14]|uniref:ScbA/BarX family gamma-butyrolactone biosynthesis protein n=1 Tax=unclassified Streptomyces TaxID=2593676 RepID=UPI00081B0B8F|nr:MULTISPECIES: ScbA/BarX family gamma-butyrolactone biosynthesis protein [unclassified Streptomyces]MYS23827.1 A-factor biosynthesis protein [Streptomyces sp. SID4948]SCE39141.1 A-factor biosynthesis hotdog domain-containing protein [Streptomyces sp. DvalAA-14]